MRQRDILVAGCGALIGAAAGFLAGMKYQKHITAKEVNAKINDILNQVGEKMDDFVEVTEEAVDENPDIWVDAADKESPQDDDPDDEVDANYYAGLMDSEEHQRVRKLPPKLITEDEFGGDPNFTPMDLYFYVGDSTLANEDEEILEDKGVYVGDCLTESGFLSSDTPVIFVRNFGFGNDYQIKKVWSSYEYACGK